MLEYIITHEIVKHITSIIELLEKLFTIGKRRRRTMFEKVLQPVYEELTLVHKDYVSMFQEIAKSLPRFTLEKGWVTESGELFIGGGEVVQGAVAKSKQSLIERRIAFDAERTSLRALSTQVLQSVDGAEEKRFAWAVINYFLAQRPAGLEDDAIDKEIRLHETLGHAGVLDTPATRVAENLAVLDNPKLMRMELDIAAAKQNELWKDVNRTFAALKISVLSRT